MAEDDFSVEQFEEEMLEFGRRCPRKIDRFDIEIGGRISEIEDRICTRLDDCLALLHQILRDRGLPVPPKRSLPPSRPESVSHASSSAPSVLSFNSLSQDQSIASSSFAIPEPATTAYFSAVIEGDNQLPHPPIGALDDDDSNLKRDGQLLSQIFEASGESKESKQVVRKGEFPFIGNSHRDFDEQFDVNCNFKGAEMWFKRVDIDVEFEDEKKVEGSRLNVPNIFFILDAYQLFAEMPEPVSMLKMFRGGVDVILHSRLIGMACLDSCADHIGGLVKLVFDPGGKIQKPMPTEYDEILLGYEHFGRFRVVNDRGVVINACNVCNELPELAMFVFDPGGQLGTETNEQIMEYIVDFIFITLTISDLGTENAEMISAEMGGLLLGDESVVFTVFDTGENCVWLNICYKDEFSFQLKLLPIHWYPEGLLVVQISAALDIIDDQVMKFRISYYHWDENPCAFDPGGKAGCSDESHFLSTIPIHWDPGGCFFVIYVLFSWS